MRVLVATDAWRPQVNGVVRSLEQMAAAAPDFGAEMTFLTSDAFRTIPMPTYQDIRLAVARPAEVAVQIRAVNPERIHIATEGPIGWVVRHVCLKLGRPFTTSYHTRFPEYLAARLPVPGTWSESFAYAWLRRFHNAGAGTMVSTLSLQRELRQRGFANLLPWSRGVDHMLFRPRESAVLDLPGPIFLFVGRLAVEKNLPAFLGLDLPGTKVVVGDGPARAELEARYPEARFLGARTGEALAEIYAAADVFVFPSRTDTFGIVLLEALASGLPVAAYPVPGPLDVVGGTGCGILDDDLRLAALAALSIPRKRCREAAQRHTWSESARQFFSNIAAADEPYRCVM